MKRELKWWHIWITAFVASMLTFVVADCKAGPFLELGIGDFMVHDWPDSPDCNCGVFLGNEGALGMWRAGIESPAYNIFWKMDMKVQASIIHISNVSNGRDTGLNAAFVGVRFE